MATKTVNCALLGVKNNTDDNYAIRNISLTGNSVSSFLKFKTPADLSGTVDILIRLIEYSIYLNNNSYASTQIFIQESENSSFITSRLIRYQEDLNVSSATYKIDSYNLKADTEYYIELKLSTDYYGNSMTLSASSDSMIILTYGSTDSGVRNSIYIDRMVIDNAIQDIELLGQSPYNTTSSLEQPTYSTTGNGAFGHFFGNGGGAYLYALKFKTPDFDGVSSKIVFNLLIDSINGSHIRHCGISTSLDNLSLYFHLSGYDSSKDPAIYDENMIAHTTFVNYNGIETFHTIEMETDKLAPNTTYYFTIYATDSSSNNTVTTVAPMSNHIATIEIIPGTGKCRSVLHQCYIDTDYYSYPTSTSECIIDGQDDYDTRYLRPDNLSYNTTETVGFGWFYSSEVDDSADRKVACVKFTTPEFTEKFHSLNVVLSLYGNISNHFRRYALCTSDANFKYYETSGDVSDPYQIATGTFYTDSDVPFITFSISSCEIESNTTYYILLWGDSSSLSSGGGTTKLSSSPNHTITVTCDLEPIYMGTRFELYTPYIDNGTTWEEL